MDNTDYSTITQIILELENDDFKECKNALLDEHICFSVIDDEAVNAPILAEKLSDYFETLELVTGKSFDKYVKAYLKHLDLIVEPHVADAEKSKKGNKDAIVVPRARKYYERAAALKEKEKLTIYQLRDYTRIMMCLYTAAIDDPKERITDFNFSADCLKPKKLLQKMQNEELPGLLLFPKKKRLKTEERYCAEECTLILTIILLHYILSVWKKGDPQYGQ